MQFKKKCLCLRITKGIRLLILFIFLEGFIFSDTTTATESNANQPGTKNTEDISDVDSAKDWKFHDFDGNTYELGHFKGKVIFINVWATWCMPCIAEMQSIQKLYDSFNNDDVVFLIASNENKEIVKRFYEESKYTFPVYLIDPLSPQPFQSSILPTTFVIDRKGNIALKRIGASDWHEQSCHEYIRSLLSNVDSTKIAKPRLGAEISDDQQLNMTRSMMTSRIETFAEQRNLSPDVKAKLIDMRVEEQTKISELMSGGNPASNQFYESNKVHTDSDERIYNLLSEEDYGAYQRYKKFEDQWVIVGQISKELKFHDMELKKDQAEQLVMAMYNDSQEMMAKQMRELQQGGIPAAQSREGMMMRRLKYQKEISAMYIDSAKKILTESQLKQFERHFDNQIYTIEKSLINRLQ